MDSYRTNEEDRDYDEQYFEEQVKPKRKKIGLRITAIVLAAALVLSGIGYGAYRIGRSYKSEAVSSETADTAREKEIIQNTVTRSQTDSTAQLQRGVNPDAEETRTSLSTNNEVDLADTDASPVVLDVSDVVENVMPCVVAITDNLEVTSSSSYNPYNYFFGGSRTPSTQESAASGSGVIIAQNEEELLIVTNNHVVDNEGNYSYYSVSSTGVTVKFIDESTADAAVKGTDKDSDLAVLSVKLSDLSDETQEAIRIAVCGDSDELKVGAGVIAIGNAMGYGQSVTTGIISAKNRDVTIDGITRQLMQTDAAINPGNSGGGLFNSKGELVGINSAKSIDTSVEGMGFAIPINAAYEIIEDLMNREVIPEGEQGYLGINGETVPDNYVREYEYPKGVSVTRIAENSPAESAGLQVYDIITAVDGKAVESMNQLKDKVNSYPAGTTIKLTVSRPEGRGFKEIELEVTLARYDEIPGLSGNSQTPQESSAEEEQPKQADPGNGGRSGDIEDFFEWLLEQLP
jgi:serine protease Do